MRKMLACMLAMIFFFSMALPSALAEKHFHPAGDPQARRQAVDLFCQCAFHPEYGFSGEDHRLTRWEQEITLWVGGTPTRQDQEHLDAFLEELSEKVSSLPKLRRVRRDSDAALRIWFIPLRMMPYYLEGYVEGNWGFFKYDTSRYRITSARIAIASDVTEQEERNHLIMEELVGAFGLPGDHDVYVDSILYDGWTITQALSDVDWRMLNLLYDPSLSPGMTEAEARGMLEAAE